MSWRASEAEALRIHGETVVHSVDNASPAATAGVKQGDVIVKIQDKKADEMRLLNLRRLFCEDGKSHRITVRRNGSLVEATIGLGTSTKRN